LEVVTNQQNSQWQIKRTGEYKGASFSEDKKKWKAELKYNNKNAFLGYFDTELDAGKAYNDYAQYMNDNHDCKYLLNTIEGYITVPRNIPKDTKDQQLDKVTSKYNGVSFDSKRNYYVVSVKLKGKSYHLGHNVNAIECAKLYNQQALYFNNHNEGKFGLNVIPDYITVEKNIHQELQANKASTKASKYFGVSKYKDTSKFRSVIVSNKKQISLGVFESELEAAQAYNKKAIELNTELQKATYKINQF
jgi:hypothetical protein